MLRSMLSSVALALTFGLSATAQTNGCLSYDNCGVGLGTPDNMKVDQYMFGKELLSLAENMSVLEGTFNQCQSKCYQGCYGEYEERMGACESAVVGWSDSPEGSNMRDFMDVCKKHANDRLAQCLGFTGFDSCDVECESPGPDGL